MSREEGEVTLEELHNLERAIETVIDPAVPCQTFELGNCLSRGPENYCAGCQEEANRRGARAALGDIARALGAVLEAVS